MDRAPRPGIYKSMQCCPTMSCGPGHDNDCATVPQFSSAMNPPFHEEYRVTSFRVWLQLDSLLSFFGGPKMGVTPGCALGLALADCKANTKVLNMHLIC